MSLRAKRRNKNTKTTLNKRMSRVRTNRHKSSNRNRTRTSLSSRAERHSKRRLAPPTNTVRTNHFVRKLISTTSTEGRRRRTRTRLRPRTSRTRHIRKNKLITRPRIDRVTGARYTRRLINNALINRRPDPNRANYNTKSGTQGRRTGLHRKAANLKLRVFSGCNSSRARRGQSGKRRSSRRRKIRGQSMRVKVNRRNSMIFSTSGNTNVSTIPFMRQMPSNLGSQPRLRNSMRRGYQDRRRRTSRARKRVTLKLSHLNYLVKVRSYRRTLLI